MMMMMGSMVTVTPKIVVQACDHGHREAASLTLSTSSSVDRVSEIPGKVKNGARNFRLYAYTTGGGLRCREFVDKPEDCRSCVYQCMKHRCKHKINNVNIDHHEVVVDGDDHDIQFSLFTCTKPITTTTDVFQHGINYSASLAMCSYPGNCLATFNYSIIK